MSSGSRANTDEKEAPLKVVVNDDGQYSIWPADREAPAGWTEDGTVGTREPNAWRTSKRSGPT